MTPPPSVTVGPSPLKVLGQVVLASFAGTAGLSILIVGLGFLANAWLLFHAGVIIACTAALFAGFCVFAVLCTVLRNRPRVEIGRDGFVSQGAFGRRPRRWTDVEGGFAAVKVGFRSVVAYRLTDAAKASDRVKPVAPPAGYDDAIPFCGELAIGARELAEVLNRWKQSAPSAGALEGV